MVGGARGTCTSLSFPYTHFILHCSLYVVDILYILWKFIVKNQHDLQNTV